MRTAASIDEFARNAMQRYRNPMTVSRMLQILVEGVASGAGATVGSYLAGRALPRARNPELPIFSAPMDTPVEVSTWSPHELSARLFIGAKVGDNVAITPEMVRAVASEAEIKLGMDPGLSVVMQLGTWGDWKTEKVVDEPSVQLVVFDTLPDTYRGKPRTPKRKQELFKKKILQLAEYLAKAFCQASIIVEITKGGVLIWKGSVGIKSKRALKKCSKKVDKDFMVEHADWIRKYVAKVSKVRDRKFRRKVKRQKAKSNNPRLLVVNPCIRGGRICSKGPMVYGLPKEKKYPMPDRSHAANAKARATQQYRRGNLTKKQYEQILRKANKILYGVAAATRGKPKGAKKRNPCSSRRRNPSGRSFKGTKEEVRAWIESQQGRPLTSKEARLFNKMWKEAQTFHGTDVLEVTIADAPEGTPPIIAGAGPLLNVDYRVVQPESARKGDWTHKAGDHARKRKTPPAWAAWGPDGRMIVVDAYGSRMRMKPTHGYVG